MDAIGPWATRVSTRCRPKRNVLREVNKGHLPPSQTSPGQGGIPVLTRNWGRPVFTSTLNVLITTVYTPVGPFFSTKRATQKQKGNEIMDQHKIEVTKVDVYPFKESGVHWTHEGNRQHRPQRPAAIERTRVMEQRKRAVRRLSFLTRSVKGMNTKTFFSR